LDKKLVVPANVLLLFFMLGRANVG